MYKCKYFKIQELVSPKVYNKFGDFAWAFFQEDILRDLDAIREVWDSPIIINNWSFGGNLYQCGLRCNIDNIVRQKSYPYCSAHIMGKAFDLHSNDNFKLFNLCLKLIETKKLSAFKRLENRKITQDCWVHIDSFQSDNIFFDI